MGRPRKYTEEFRREATRKRANETKARDCARLAVRHTQSAFWFIRAFSRAFASFATPVDACVRVRPVRLTELALNATQQGSQNLSAK